MITVLTSELPAALAVAVSGKPHKMYMYLEYANGSGNVPDYTSVVPNFESPKTYYDGLGANKNYIRVPAVLDPTAVNSSSGTAPSITYTSTSTYFGQSNSSTVSVGVNTGGFAFGNNVYCYGAALVLCPDDSDKTKDLVMARAYFTDSTLQKTSSSELFVTMPFTTTAIG
jgi:hypothetical protein